MPDHSPAQFNLDSERALLGSVLAGGLDALADAGDVRPVDFHDHRHRWIFDAMRRLEAAGQEIDIITVTNELDQAGKLEEMGAVAYLTQLVTDTPYSTHAAGYAKIVCDLAAKRAAIALLNQTATAVFNANGNAAEIMGKAGADLAELAASMAPAAAVFRWAAEAFDPQPPVEWIVEPLFSPACVALMVGTGGSKKTYCSLDLAVCRAMGKDWLQFATRQGTVLIVDEESGPRRLARRLGEIMAAHGADQSIPLAYTSLAAFNLRDPACVAELDATIARTGATLVIIDALADIMAGGDENAVQDTQPVFMTLRRLAEKHQAAIVVIHHTGKSGDYRGSSALKGAVDLLLKVTSEPRSKQIHFEVEKGRDIEPFKFSATIAFEQGRTVITGADDTAAPAANVGRLPPGALFALRYLAEHGPTLLSQITANANTCSGEAARQGVYRLALEGLADRTDAGGPGTRAVYGLTVNGGRLAGVKVAGG